MITLKDKSTKESNVFIKMHSLKEYNSFKKKHKSFLLLMSKSDNCTPTKTMKFIINEVAKSYKFKVIEITKTTELGITIDKTKYIGTYPTLILFKQFGKLMPSGVGIVSIEQKRFTDCISKDILTTYVSRIFKKKKNQNE